MATIALAIALASGGVAAADALPPVVIGEVLSVDFGFDIRPSELPKKEARPTRISFSGGAQTDDGSHVPALTELEIKLDRHLALDIDGVPVCDKGTLNERRKILEGCEGAVVGRGTVEAEIAFPEQPLTTVTGTLTIYNRGRKPGGFDLLGWAYFPAPVTGATAVPVKVRKIDGGRYGSRARLEIPKLAGGYGSITSYSARIRKRIASATCPDGKLQVGASAVFADGTSRFTTVIHTCSVAEADPRQ